MKPAPPATTIIIAGPIRIIITAAAGMPGIASVIAPFPDMQSRTR
jgi:hypothetical protein